MISIIIPTYNRAHLVLKTVKSVFAQTFTDFEIIVVDDGSTENIKLALAEFFDLPNFRYVRQNNQGRSEARNNGMNISSGEYLMFLDSDDILTDEALAILCKLSRNYPESGIIGGSRKYIDERGNFLNVKDELAVKSELFNKKVELEKIRSFFLPPSSYIIKSDLAKSLGGFKSAFEPCEDFDFFLKFCEATKISVTTKIILHMRRHTGNTPHRDIFDAAMNIAEMNYEYLKSNPQKYPHDLTKQMKVEWQLRMADDYYAAGDKLKAYKHYYIALRISPKLMFDKSVVKHIMLNSMPTSLRLKYQNRM